MCKCTLNEECRSHHTVGWLDFSKKFAGLVITGFPVSGFSTFLHLLETQHITDLCKFSIDIDYWQSSEHSSSPSLVPMHCVCKISA